MSEELKITQEWDKVFPKVEDFQSAVDFLSNLENVDSEKIYDKVVKI